MRPVARRESNDNQLLFLPGVFNETLTLLFDAHEYFQTHGAEEQSLVGSEFKSAYASEMTRVTLRLTSVMAWIMVRRAVTAGRIEEEKAAGSYRLVASDIALEIPEDTQGALPSYLTHLSERSHELYQRVSRLDEMVYGDRPTTH